MMRKRAPRPIDPPVSTPPRHMIARVAAMLGRTGTSHTRTMSPRRYHNRSTMPRSRPETPTSAQNLAYAEQKRAMRRIKRLDAAGLPVVPPYVD